MLFLCKIRNIKQMNKTLNLNLFLTIGKAVHTDSTYTANFIN